MNKKEIIKFFVEAVKDCCAGKAVAPCGFTYASNTLALICVEVNGIDNYIHFYMDDKMPSDLYKGYHFHVIDHTGEKMEERCFDIEPTDSKGEDGEYYDWIEDTYDILYCMGDTFVKIIEELGWQEGKFQYYPVIYPQAYTLDDDVEWRCVNRVCDAKD